MIKKHYSAIIFGVAIILGAYFLANAYQNRNKTQSTISVTGLGKQDFTSDLIVWEASFSGNGYTLQEAYDKLNSDKEKAITYLTNKGVKKEDIIFNAVVTETRTKSKYNDKGEYIGNEFAGYNLTQKLKIESKEVDKIESISRESTELLNQGINFYSNSPRYYYTKLADLKIDMISKATEDARIRAEHISEKSGGSMGDLLTAKMGIFQITGQNSGENYSWGGAYNTSSRKKTATITMKLVYSID